MRKNHPPINVYNRQRQVPFPTGGLREFLQHLAERLGVEKGFSVVLLSDRGIQRFNRRYRKRNQPTDVLSFPDRSENWEEESYLGDILISLETAQRQASDLDKELKILALHGLLHLLGFDHETDQGEMVRLERALRKEFRLS